MQGVKKTGGGLTTPYHVYIYIPVLPKDMENQHVRVKDMIYSKFMVYP